MTALRICPACIAECHLMLKSSVLAGLSACAVHRLTLQSRCVCGRALFAWGKRTRPFVCGTCGAPWDRLPRRVVERAHVDERALRESYSALPYGPGHNTYSRSRLLIREAVEARVAAGDLQSTSADVQFGRVLVNAVPSVATLAIGLARFGIPAELVAAGYDADLQAERAHHRRIKLGLAAAWFCMRVQRSEGIGCWCWSGPVDENGFGFVRCVGGASGRACLHIGTRTSSRLARFRGTR